MSQYKAISLFSGAGGCSLGYTSAGVDIIAAYDNWKEAVDTYNYNFVGKKAHILDLSSCVFKSVRDNVKLNNGTLDFIIGGPPCQGFSSLGKQDPSDPRNKLIENYANAIEIFSPRWFMMENVEGILTTADGDFIVSAIERFVRLGYSIYLKKIYMHEYSVPQRRKRVIVVGSKEGKQFAFPPVDAYANGFRFKNGVRTLHTAISDLENIDIPSINHVRKQEVGVKQARIRALRQGQSMKDLPKELQHESFSRRASRRVCDGTPSEKRGGAPSGMKRLVYDEPSLTITGSATSELIHPVEDRMLTIRECARIQTFPDNFIFCGSDSQQMQQIGNAVPPLFAKLMAMQIMKYDATPCSAVEPGLISCELSKSSAMSPNLKRTCSRLAELQPLKIF